MTLINLKSTINSRIFLVSIISSWFSSLACLGACPIVPNYFLRSVDDYSRVKLVYLINILNRFSMFVAFCTEIQAYLGIVKILHNNNALNISQAPFSTYMTEEGIIHQSYCIVHLNRVAMAISFQMNAPKSFWDDALLTACHLVNRMRSFVQRVFVSISHFILCLP